MNIVIKKVKFKTLVIIVNIILVVLFQSVYVDVNMNRLEEYAQNTKEESVHTYHSYLCDNFSACMYEVDMLRSFIRRNYLTNYVKPYLNLKDEEYVKKYKTAVGVAMQQLSVSGNMVRDFIIFGENFNQKNLYCDVQERKMNETLLPSQDALLKIGLDGILHTNLGYLVKCTEDELNKVKLEIAEGEERDAILNFIQYLKDEYIVCDYIDNRLVVIRLQRDYIEEKFRLEGNNKFLVYHSSGRPVLCFNMDETYAEELLEDISFDTAYYENEEYSYSVSQNLYGKLGVVTEYEDDNGYISFINSKYVYILFAAVSVLISFLCSQLFSARVFKKIKFLHTTIKKQAKSDALEFMDVSRDKLTFSKRILLTFMSSGLLSLLAVSMGMNAMIEWETRAVVEKLGNQLAVNYANEYAIHYERYNSVSTVKIEKLLQEFKKDSADGNEELIREFEDNFYYETTFLPEYSYAFITGNNDEIIYQTVYSSQEQLATELIRSAISKAEELRHSETQGVLVPVDDLLSGRQSLAFVKDVYYNGTNKGTLVIISDMPEQAADGEESTLLTDFVIVNQENRMIVGDALAYNRQLAGKKEKFDANEEILYSIDESTMDYIGKAVVLTYYRFYVNQIRAIQYTNLLWTLMIAAVCVVATFLLRRILVKPFNMLIASMNATPEQGYRSIPEQFTIDEVDAIAVAYNKMMGRMETLVEESVRKEAERNELEILQAQTEFKMLEQQMNPHFLFNTLECVNLLAFRTGEKNISKIVQSLSMILRYAISRETKVKVRREIQVLESYIEIQRFRFGDKISIEMDVDESLFELHMIKFVLQPVLENAISHGLANSTGDGKIDIILGCYESGLEFRIRDNGLGMSEEKLQELRESLHSQVEQVQENREGGIGLRNVCRRIDLYYKGEGDFIVNSVEGEGTEVVLRLPFDL